MADPLKNIDPRLSGLRPEPIGPRPPGQKIEAAGSNFAELLVRAKDAHGSGVRFSAHAQTRVQSREIALGPEEVRRIEDAVERAAKKGARSSLILVDETAFLVSVANRTVITVVDKENIRQNVFTNIDSAVIG